MATERKISDRFGDGSGSVGQMDIDRVFEEFLHAENPISALSVICQKIPRVYSSAELSKLYIQKRFDCLGFACLPTLNSCLTDFKDFSELETDLVEEGLVVLFQAISEWNPSIRSEGEKPEPLRQVVGNKIRYRLTEFVARRYGLCGTEDFPLVKLYKKCWEEFVTEHGRQPELQEINTLVEEENKGTFSLFLREDTKDPERNAEKNSKVKLMYYSTQRISDGDPVSQQGSECEWSLFQHCLRDDMYRIMSALSPREKAVLRLIFLAMGK